MKNIIIICPGNVISGGVNSLLNLCSALSRNGFNATISYYNIDNQIINNNLIKSYNIKQFNGELDSENNIVVVTETQITRINQFTKAKKIVYWLGLLYYYKNPVWKFPFNYKLLRKLIACHSYAGYSNGFFELGKRRLNEYAKSKINIWTDDFIHLSNSYFVADFCKQKGAKNTYVLQNPIHNEFYDTKINKNRENLILFGQRSPKLIVFLSKLLFKNYKIVKLRKLTHKQVVDYMSNATVFIELGINHGRDRMPREAAMLGCVVFINRKGSSSNIKDYNLDKYYILRSRIWDYFKILGKIKDAINNYDTHFKQQSNFRQQLINERKNFDSNVKDVFNRIINVE